jgi:zinc transport system ATP-binding protein
MIKATQLGLQIEGTRILEAVSFTIKKGEYVGLIGPNGAGKTSLIKLLLGFWQPTTGELKIAPQVRIGYVPQSYTLSSVVPISVAEVLRMSNVKDKTALGLNLSKVGLETVFLTKNFHTLSGGQKQRVIIARALCQNPDLIIFDEPLNGVDFETKLKIYDILASLNKNEGVTILFVSHEVDHIIDKCHHILCLNRTMHTGCHPLDFAKGELNDCPVLTTSPQVVPVHHHHGKKSDCSC